MEGGEYAFGEGATDALDLLQVLGRRPGHAGGGSEGVQQGALARRANALDLVQRIAPQVGGPAGPVASDGTRGSFIAGAGSEVAITIPATATGGTIDGVPYHVRGQPIRATFDAAFDPRAYVEQNFPDDAGAILKAAVPSLKGGWKIDPISVSGGSISILGDTLTGDAAMADRQR